MKGRIIALDRIGDRQAAALIVDGALDDLLIETDQPAPGTIYRAQATRPMKGQGGMFLTTPDGPAFLRQVKGLAPGAMLTVMVTGYSEPGKAIPVTQRLLFKSRYAIVTPEAPGLNISRRLKDDDLRDTLLEIAHEVMADDPNGLILRSSCHGAAADDIAADIQAMQRIAHAVTADEAQGVETLLQGDGPHDIAWREWLGADQLDADPGSFDRHDVTGMIDALHSPLVGLAQSGSMMVEPTRALIAVDVNTGADTSPAAGLKANLAAARHLPRALRLRGLGGQITIDVAPMAKKDRRVFENALRAAFRADTEDTVLAGWTPLGHYELQRKRGRLPLREVLG